MLSRSWLVGMGSDKLFGLNCEIILLVFYSTGFDTSAATSAGTCGKYQRISALLGTGADTCDLVDPSKPTINNNAVKIQ